MENEFDKIISFENLYRAFRRSRRGQSYKRAAQRFEARCIEGTLALQAILNSGQYQVSPYHTFTVSKPKQRVIMACQFKDKIIQHCLCDNAITPRLESIFIDDSYGSRKDKGLKAARTRLKENMRTMYSKHGNQFYVLKCDVSKYFYSINHEILEDTVQRYFGEDEKIMDLCRKFINSTEGDGIALGNQINQCFANLYMDAIDKMILNRLRARAYGRYMDDFYIMSPDKRYLQYCKTIIREQLERVKLELNPKTQITPIRRGISWLGFNYSVSDDGHIYARVNNRKKRDAIRRYKAKTRDYVDGKLTREQFRRSWASWTGHVKSEGCIGLIHAVRRIIFEEYIRYTNEKKKQAEQAGEWR